MPPPDDMDRVHDSAVIISTGDELALGEKLDTNSAWLAERLTSRGIRVVAHLTVGDDETALVRAITHAADGGVALIVVTGGLGPTLDDLTRQALARALGESLIEDTAALEHLGRLMRSRGRTLSDLQRLQALRPSSAVMLPNPHGTAPGLFALVRGTAVFCLPGPPPEMKPMFEGEVLPRLRPPEGRSIAARVLHTLGLPEAEIGTRLGELMRRGRNPSVGTTASGGVVSCRIRYVGDAANADRELDAVESQVRGALGPCVFGSAEETIQSSTLAELRARDDRLVTVESCTGGLLGALITGVPGSSSTYLGGFVTYANEFKSGLLGVNPVLLERHGAVSCEAAEAMARGALAAIPHAAHEAPQGTIHALAITGIAGPEGGSEAKPVGTVFIAHAAMAARGAGSAAGRDACAARRFHFPGDRAAIRDRAAKMALAMLRFDVIGAGAERLLWEVEMDGRPRPS